MFLCLRIYDHLSLCVFVGIHRFVVYACVCSMPLRKLIPVFVCMCVYVSVCVCVCLWPNPFVCMSVLDAPYAFACACVCARGLLDNYRQAADCRLDGELDPNQNHHYLRNEHLLALEKSTEDFSSFCSLRHFLVNKLRFISDLSQLCSQIESQSSIQNENQNIYCFLRLPSLHF